MADYKPQEIKLCQESNKEDPVLLSGWGKESLAAIETSGLYTTKKDQILSWFEVS